MQREAKTFLSKAWSGSSLTSGAQNMFAAFIKQEQALPDDVDSLRQRVEDLRRQLGMGSAVKEEPCGDAKQPGQMKETGLDKEAPKTTLPRTTEPRPDTLQATQVEETQENDSQAPEFAAAEPTEPASTQALQPAQETRPNDIQETFDNDLQETQPDDIQEQKPSIPKTAASSVGHSAMGHANSFVAHQDSSQLPPEIMFKSPSRSPSSPPKNIEAMMDGAPLESLPAPTTAREKQLYEIIAHLQRTQPGTPSMFAPASVRSSDPSVKSRPERLDSVTSLATSLSDGVPAPKDLPPMRAPAPATPVSDGTGTETKESAAPTGPTDDEDDCESPEEKKLYARMEAKIRRMCTPSPTTGKTTASPQLLAEWKSKGYTRTQLMQLMIEANGDKAQFQTKLESWRQTEQFRKVQTRGGWYSEQDMKKPVSEGGCAYSAKKVQKVKDFCEKHGFVRNNKYDEDEKEYWVDFRTEGSRGTNEIDAVREKKMADTTGAEGFVTGAVGDGPLPELPIQGGLAPGIEKEDQGLAKIMDDAFQTRKNLDKLVAKLKKDKGNAGDIASMEECISKLGSLYDDLAGIQAEVKVNGMDDKLKQQLAEKTKAVKRQCVLAVSCEIKNKSIKRKEPPPSTEEPQSKRKPKSKTKPSKK
ncbi:unnamed protein product [Symbiodinium sp. CCMP2592]|nr:unnamed protein product [Symbiodinium sp. CCMP2592]